MLRLLRVFCPLLLAAAPFAHAQMPSMPGMPSQGGGTSFPKPMSHLSGELGSGLSESQLGDGVKETLSVGTQKAVHLVDHPGGYLDNAAIRILLPAKLKPVESGLRAAGQGPRIDEFVASMNHAAEQAAPEAEHIFAEAVRAMTIEDARRLINGGDTAITDYFKQKTGATLTAAFKPHVQAAMQANGVTARFDELQSQAPKLPFMKQENFDITNYVVSKAIDGLFYELAQQEREIRSNPAARTTSLLKDVFGKH